jgi:hypothetical protein
MRFRNKTDTRRHPGEPLYKLSDFAARTGLSVHALGALMRHHPGLKAWTTGNSPQYRMSDFVRWYNALPKENAAQQK